MVRRGQKNKKRRLSLNCMFWLVRLRYFFFLFSYNLCFSRQCTLFLFLLYLSSLRFLLVISSSCYRAYFVCLIYPSTSFLDHQLWCKSNRRKGRRADVIFSYFKQTIHCRILKIASSSMINREENIMHNVYLSLELFFWLAFDLVYSRKIFFEKIYGVFNIQNHLISNRALFLNQTPTFILW